jgi:hypothetical protein
LVELQLGVAELLPHGQLMLKVKVTPAGGGACVGSFGSMTSCQVAVLEQPRQRPPSDSQNARRSEPVGTFECDGTISLAGMAVAHVSVSHLDEPVAWTP